jgi:arylsulfatase A-like enzyme
MGEERIDARSTDHDSGRRPDRWRTVLTGNVPVVIALSCAAVGLPLLDLYGNNPTVFVTADLSSAQIVAFAALVVVLPALIVTAVEVATRALAPRALRWVHAALVAGLAGAVALVILRKLVPALAWPAVVVALAVGVSVAYAERAWDVVRTLLRYAVVLPVVVLVMFLAVSPTSDLFGAEADAIALPDDGAYPPVLFLVFDELPLVSLMSSDGEVREDLYPNFARLAATSNWYRNAASQSSATELSLPSLLSGQVPDPTAVGSSVDWPDNLFTLLGDEYDVRAHEAATHLCPTSVCDAPVGDSSSMGAFFDDAAVVWGHLVLPSPWRDDLPAIDQTWGGFVDDLEISGDAEPSAAAVDEAAHSRLADEGIGPRLKEVTTADARAEPITALTGTVDRAAPQRLHFAHALFPHFPWQTTPEGRVVADPPDLDLGRPQSGPDRNRWADDEALTRFWLQRHLLQVGAADRMLGEVVDRYEQEGLWEDALVVVLADHGASFEPGRFERGFEGTDNFDDMYRVPLFVKLPGQLEGTVIDEPAQLLDVVPTIVDALGLEVEWDFDGRSLLSDPAPATRSIYHPDGSMVVPNGIDGLYRAVERKESRFATGAGWLSIAAAGDLGRYVGRDVDDLDVEVLAASELTIDQAAELADVDVASTPVPIVITGTIDRPGIEPGRELLLAVNGTVAGVAHIALDGKPNRFAGLVAEELLTYGSNDVDVLLVAG